MKHHAVNPFHAGERAAQKRAGVEDVSQWAGGFIRDHLPTQHRTFHTSLPFLVFAGADGDGRVWATIVDGDDGFIHSPDPQHLTLKRRVDQVDPLAERFAEGGDIGGLGIDLATRRRNRFSGNITPQGEALTIAIRQTFGNCPQYIHPRGLDRVTRGSDNTVAYSNTLSDDQIARIGQADTLFIGSGYQAAMDNIANGFDASHRGGTPGFVQVASPTRLLIPDYAGNNFFNTIGNLISDPRIGLLFVDFHTGGLLHLTGRAKIDWSPHSVRDPNAKRFIEVDVDAVVDRPAALSLRWRRLDNSARKLQLVRRVKEANRITSFYFSPVDGGPLDPFQPGQHLPIAVQVPGQTIMIKRTYSLSGAAADLSQYRLSIKREDDGLISRFLHDEFRPGDMIEALSPAGNFVVPEGTGPVVLISAGVGMTPMISMLHMLAGQERKVWYVHSARNGHEHAMGAEVAGLITCHAKLHRRLYFSAPRETDQLGSDYDVKGRIDVEDIVQLSPEEDTQYLICGPARFLAELRSGLESRDIPATNIHFENFGPGQT